MPTKVQTLITAGLAAIVAAVWLQSCFSPQPLVSQPAVSKAVTPISVSNIRLVDPPSTGGDYRIEATVMSSGYTGPVVLAYRLRNRGTGETIERLGRVEVRPGTALISVFEISAPPADYVAEVDVRSPTR